MVRSNRKRVLSDEEQKCADLICLIAEMKEVILVIDHAGVY